MSRLHLFSCFVLALAASVSSAQSSLPIVEEVDWPTLRDHSFRLLRGLKLAKAELPPETAPRLEALLSKEPGDPQAAGREVQKLLDACCLLGVSINAESRVKASRGPAAAELKLGRERIVLVKVQNDAGVTHPLAVRGPQLVLSGKKEAGRWLEAVILAEPPFERRLSGRRLDYCALRLKTQEMGKREATFQFDVGQGTQDLGFRAEVPVLFTVR
jgi:hypothetical protein